MGKQLLVLIAATLSFGVFPVTGHGQGAAEYAITTSHAAAATAKAGSALDKATERLAGRVQEQLSRSATEPQPASRQPGKGQDNHAVSTKTEAAGPANGVDVICGPGAHTTGKQLGNSSQSASCVSSRSEGLPGAKANPSSTRATQERYPSVVKLTFPK